MTQQQSVYLDYAAATPVDERVLAAMQPYFCDRFYNPSSPYAPSVQVRRDVEDARHRIAQTIGVKPADVILTAGATESINLAMTAVGDGEIITSTIEHPAVLESAKQYSHTLIDVSSTGLIDVDDIVRTITPNTQLVSIGLANNELGTIQPVRRIADAIQRERDRRSQVGESRPLWLHTDASQGVGQLDMTVSRLGVDLLTLNSAKCYGPKQVGLLWRAPGVQLRPIIHGGGQEAGVRSGTENVPGVIGFATALEIAARTRNSETKRLQELRDTLQRHIESGIDIAEINGHQKKRLAGHLHVSVPGIDAERFVFMLESVGVYVATGSACAANHGTRSHVLEAVGMSAQQADGSLRLTLGRHTDDAAIEYAAEQIIIAVQSERDRIGL